VLHGPAVSTDLLHVHPVADLIEHEITDSCPCGPQARPVKRDDGSVGWLLVHSSLDGREAGEGDAS